MLVFFGDPESDGEIEDALKCVEMALRMLKRVEELKKHWKKLGVSNGMKVRMGIATGFCTVGNFGSELRMDYTVLGSPVNLAARLQAMAEPNTILIDENTKGLIENYVEAKHFEEITPRGFVRPVQVYQIKDFISAKHREQRRKLIHVGERVEVSVFDSSDIRKAIEELRLIQQDFEREYDERNGNPK